MKDEEPGASDRGQIKRVYESSPGMDCGLCGFGNCLGFAKAFIEGRAPVLGCRRGPRAADRIARILRTGRVERTPPLEQLSEVDDLRNEIDTMSR